MNKNNTEKFIFEAYLDRLWSWYISFCYALISFIRFVSSLEGINANRLLVGLVTNFSTTHIQIYKIKWMAPVYNEAFSVSIQI